MAEWKETTFGKEAFFVSEKIESGHVSREDYISTENMLPNRGGITLSSAYPNEGRFNRYRVNDTLFSNIRTYFRKVWQADRDGGASPDVLIIRSRENRRLDPDYLFYIACSTSFMEFTVLTSKGAKMPRGDKDAILGYSLGLPPIDEQKAIAEVLGALDDKIELNRKMNATLEAMARALFKSWFVDFDPVRAKSEGREPFGMDAETAALFPSSFIPSALGEIPEGWGASTLGTEFDITMGQSPPGETYNEAGDGLPFFQGRTDFGFRYPSRRVFCTQPNRIAEPGDTLISVRAPVGDINMAFEKCILGRGVAAIRHKSKALGYSYYAVGSLQSNLKAFEADGTVFGAINKQGVEKLSIIAPQLEVIARFEELVVDIDQKILSNTKETLNLEVLRDYLLPKLISGEIRIPDAEKMVEGM